MSDAPNFANWDLTPFFPSFAGPEYCAFRDALREEIGALQARIRELPSLGEEVAAWAQALVELEGLYTRASHLVSYLHCLKSADARDEQVGAEYSAFQALWAEFSKTLAQVQGAFKAADDAAFARFVADPRLEGAGYRMTRLREEARHTMSPELEELAADLGVTGIQAWGRLYSAVAGRLEFELCRPDGTRETVPMSLRRSFGEDPDPAVRQAAQDGANAAWAGVEHVTAAALNAIAGTRLALYRRRGVEHFLEPSLFDAAITRETLDAMHAAIDERAELPRRYLRLKARILGRERLRFSDLNAPLPLGDVAKLPWEEATAQVLAAFSATYPALGEFARDALAQRWVDSEPRAGRASGGFCTTSKLLKQSRIFMTFNGALGDVRTLAHELGHAYHNWVVRDLRTYQRSYPMTLAETASTFAEAIYTDAVLQDPNASPRAQARILARRLDAATAFLLNIPMRFSFEEAFYTERAEGEVSVARIQELLLAAQQRWYGDALDPAALDPYFWASKLHFYISGVSFYNFPYSFGYLFSLGVYQRAREAGREFFPTYEELLRQTGQATAEAVARGVLGIELETPAFWLESMRSVEDDLSRFEALAGELFPAG